MEIFIKVIDPSHMGGQSIYPISVNGILQIKTHPNAQSFSDLFPEQTKKHTGPVLEITGNGDQRIPFVIGLTGDAYVMNSKGDTISKISYNDLTGKVAKVYDLRTTKPTFPAYLVNDTTYVEIGGSPRLLRNLDRQQLIDNIVTATTDVWRHLEETGFEHLDLINRSN